jgi:hypothetical protein
MTKSAAGAAIAEQSVISGVLARKAAEVGFGAKIAGGNTAFNAVV